MAIYHCSIKVVGRSQGRSAVAAAAYRAGEKIENERDGIVHDFTRKSGVVHTEIMAPKNAPEWATDRNRLWNVVETIEKRKDAQLAKEVEVALPKEFSKEQQLQLVRDYVQDQFVSRGMIADIAIHDKGDGNPHAHILLSTREITPEGFGKKNRDWNPDFANSQNQNGFVKDSAKCVDWRAAWADHANSALERVGIQERIDHRSLKEQGLDRMPTIHEGPNVREMEKRHVKTDRGDLNRLAKEYNAVVIELEAYRKKKEERQKEAQELKSELINGNAVRSMRNRDHAEQLNQISNKNKELQEQKSLPDTVSLQEYIEQRKQKNEGRNAEVGIKDNIERLKESNPEFAGSIEKAKENVRQREKDRQEREDNLRKINLSQNRLKDLEQRNQEIEKVKKELATKTEERNKLGLFSFKKKNQLDRKIKELEKSLKAKEADLLQERGLKPQELEGAINKEKVFLEQQTASRESIADKVQRAKDQLAQERQLRVIRGKGNKSDNQDRER